MPADSAYMIPTSAKEVQALGWDYIDVIILSGDAFVFAKQAEQKMFRPNVVVVEAASFFH